MEILYSDLLDNKKNLRSLPSKLKKCKNDLIKDFGKNFTSILKHKIIIKINRTEIIKLFKTKKTTTTRSKNFY